MATVIFTLSLKDYEGITWQGREVFNRHAQISNFLKKSLGEQYVHFFANPHISKNALKGKGKAKWSSEVFTEKSKSIVDITETDQAHYLSIYERKKNVILDYCKKLGTSAKEDDKNWAQLIETALQIPDDSHIFIENDDVCLVAWGFKFKAGKKTNYDLTKKLKIPSIDEKPIDKPVKKEPIEEKPANETPEIHQSTEEKPIEKDPVKETPEKEEEPTFDEPIEEKPEPESPVENEEPQNYLPEKPNVIIPVDPSKIIMSPDKISIVEDRLNIALQEDNTNIEEFSQSFKKIYKDDYYKVIYYSPLTHRLQIQIPPDKREELKSELPKQLSNFKMLIWHESIFKSNTDNLDQKKKTWFYDIIQAHEAWQISKGANNVVIAVIDNCFDLNSNFSAEIYKPLNVVEGNQNLHVVGNKSDHGNHVAGIAVGLSDEAKGVHGVAPDCKLMPIQVSDNYGTLSNTAIIDAILYAVANGANVINISLGKNISDDLLNSSVEEQQKIADTKFKDEEAFWKQIFTSAYENNISIVISAGNEDILLDIDPMNRCKKTIRVSAVDHNEYKAEFSNFGKNSTISAPGVDIFSSLSNNKVGYMSGTSMAAPFVTGSVAIIKSIKPELKHDEIVDLIQKTGKKITVNNKYIGNLIQLGEAVKAISNIPPTKNIKPSWFKRNWKWLLLILLALLLLAICLIFCNSKKSYLPDNPNVIPPIDTTKIVTDPDSVRVIISDRLNVALQGGNQDIIEFAKQFKKNYPSDDYQIIYYDTLTYRIQLQIPADELQKIKQELPDKLSDFEMLIWDESLFQNNYTPQDPGFSDLRKSWYHIEVKAIEAWDISKGDPNIVVAIIDNGFDLNHPEFEGKIYKPWNITTNSADVNTGLDMIHGTHVAGIATGLADNGDGVAGIAPNCKFMPIQVGDYNGMMSNTAVVDAILYAINNGADVVNMSLGQTFDPRMAGLPQSAQEEYIKNYFLDEEDFYNQLFDMAYKKNIVFVLAAGNQDILIGLDPMQRSNKTIKVSAIDYSETKADFSNYGTRSTISAPGVQIFSSVPNSGFDYLDGTSMAAPVVTGGVALIKSVNPSLSFDEIVDLIQSTGIPANYNRKEIGNILQLDVALGIANRNRNTQPIVNCPDKQAQIDSLLQEIEKIRRECPDTNQASGDTLKIPDNPDDFYFAEGKWKSTTYIYSTTTGEKVTLYFEFFANGSGKLTLVEADNTQCSANLDLSLSGNTFIINQKNASICNPPPRTYNEYIFECEPDNNGCADCWAQNKINQLNKFKFKLVKIN